MALLEVNNLEVKYCRFILVLKALSVRVGEGSITAVLGSNGTGKSTLLKAISGLLKQEDGEITRGEILFKLKDITHLSPSSIVRRGIVQVLEGRGVFDELTVEENLKAGAYTNSGHGEVSKNIERVYTYFPILRNRRKRVSGYLSGGEQQMLAIGRALMAKPRLLILDEPTLGLAPLMANEVIQIILRINGEEKSAILLVEQNAYLSLGIASYAYVMEDGRVVAEGLSKDLVTHRNIQEFYLGKSDQGDRKSYREVKHYKRRKRWFSS
jgi:branched-chain amino acid transport system ATP-binding protein